LVDIGGQKQQKRASSVRMSRGLTEKKINVKN